MVSLFVTLTKIKWEDGTQYGRQITAGGHVNMLGVPRHIQGPSPVALWAQLLHGVSGKFD